MEKDENSTHKIFFCKENCSCKENCIMFNENLTLLRFHYFIITLVENFYFVLFEIHYLEQGKKKRNLLI